jgi:cardiolipin synthase
MSDGGSNWNLANAITVSRVALVPVFVAAFVVDRPDLALVVFALAGLSDALDGVLARLLKQRTQFGALLDPLADKLFAAVLMVVLWWRGLADWRLLALAAGMDLHAVLLPLMIIIRRRRRGQPLRPAPRVQTNTWGKLKTAVLAWSMGFIILGTTFGVRWMTLMGTYCIWLAIGLGLVAMERYFAAYRAGNFE